jgi:hypothetical protein
MSSRYSDGVQAFFAIQMALHIALCVLSFLLLQFRRKIEPLKSRSPLVLSTFVPLNCFVVIDQCLLVIYHKDYPCQRAVFDYFLFCSTVVVYTVVRFGFTYIKFQIAHESLTATLSTTSTTDSRGISLGGNAVIELKKELKKPFWSQYRKWIQEPRITLVCWGMLVTFFIPGVIFAEKAKGTLGTLCFDKNVAYGTVRSLYQLGAVLFSVWGLQVPKGGLGFILDLSGTVMGDDSRCCDCRDLAAFQRHFLSCVFRPQSVSCFSSGISRDVHLLPIHRGNYSSIYLSFKEERETKVSLNISKTFEDIISHPWGQNAFVKFLETEFSLENWLFKENVFNYQKFASEQLRAADDTTNLEAKMAVRAKFEERVTEFINEDGVYTVNISGQMGEDSKNHPPLE